MSSSNDLLDVIGPWSEVKLDIIRKYAKAYSTILSGPKAARSVRSYSYIDAFAGAGQHISGATGELVPGSPAIALDTDPPFNNYYFVDIDNQRVDNLERIAEERAEVTVFRGDANEVLLREVLPHVRYEDFRRALCLLDPYRLQLDWEVVATAGEMRSVEIFLNFPIMDINRNVLRAGGPVSDEKEKEMTRFWGDESWKTSAFSSEKQLGLFGQAVPPGKASNAVIVEAYRKRLRDVAGFRYVPEPLPMRNSKNADVYYLFFASPNETGRKIVRDIFAKHAGGTG